MIGDLYEQGDKRRDSAFTIYYMIFNGGAISLFMGVWFLSSFLAHLIGGFMVQFMEKPGAYNLFLTITIFIIALGIIVFTMARKLVTWMHGRD